MQAPLAIKFPCVLLSMHVQAMLLYRYGKFLRHSVTE